MQDTTVILVVVLCLAVVGGMVYYDHSKKSKAVRAPRLHEVAPHVVTYPSYYPPGEYPWTYPYPGYGYAGYPYLPIGNYNSGHGGWHGGGGGGHHHH